MEFEPSFKYLMSLLSSSVDEEEAAKIIREAIYSAGLTLKETNYEIDEFMKVCEQLMNRGGKTRIVGLTGMTPARCYRTLHGLTSPTGYATKLI
jgi:hypothetical protein